MNPKDIYLSIIRSSDKKECNRDILDFESDSEDNKLADPEGKQREDVTVDEKVDNDLEDKVIKEEKLKVKFVDESENKLEYDAHNLKDIHNLFDECSSSLHKLKKGDLQKKYTEVDILSKVDIGFELIRQRLLTCTYTKLSTKELSELQSVTKDSGDPSVEYFGLDWSSVFSRLDKLCIQLRQFSSKMERSYLSIRCLKTCLSLIYELRSEVDMHMSALQSGRLCSEQLISQYEQQLAYGNIGRTGSFNAKHNQNRDKSVSKSASVKYQGSKTDSVLVSNKLKHEKEKDRRQTKEQRKSSFIDNISNIFH